MIIHMWRLRFGSEAALFLWEVDIWGKILTRQL